MNRLSLVFTIGIALLFIAGMPLHSYSQRKMKKKELNSFCMDKVKQNMPGKKLGKKEYLYSDYHALKLEDLDQEFGVVQFGKRKYSDVFMYIKLSPSNSCVEKDKNIVIELYDGTTFTLENEYKSNCSGMVVTELSESTVKKISKSSIKSIRVLSFNQDMQMQVSAELGSEMGDEIYCLENKKF